MPLRTALPNPLMHPMIEATEVTPPATYTPAAGGSSVVRSGRVGALPQLVEWDSDGLPQGGAGRCRVEPCLDGAALRFHQKASRLQ